MTTKAAGAGGKERSKPRRRVAAEDSAAHILAAPRGVRVVSHRDLKAAVEKVFRKRLDANA